MAVDKSELIVVPLERAFAVFKRFYEEADSNSDFDRAAIIQAFEFCYELAWKTVKKVLEIQGLDLVQNSPKGIFREAAINGLIDDPKLWFEFIKSRNLTAHTYQEEVSINVYSKMDEFRDEMEKLLPKIRERLK